ncbi:MAG TPA: hypothetical protein ACFYD4_10100 [Candidatus Wunengus sp. YC61]|uniref:hypothetical protein n=1 Tax=Candidatus Wunengus sp. YC61 TaxID=3367698 RepID=UPI004028F0C2
MTRVTQQQQEELNRAPKLPQSSSITDIALPNPTANNYIGWNAGATQLENKAVPVVTTATAYEIDALVSYGNGTSFTQATIEAALTAIGTENKVTLLFRPGTWPIISNADWSAYTNVTFKIVQGAVLQIATGTTTTIGGQIDAGFTQVFNCVGTGKVVLSTQQAVHASWFGYATTSTGANNAIYVNKAILSLPTGATVILPAGNYTMSKVTCLISGVTIENHGNITQTVNGNDSMFKFGDGATAMNNNTFRNYGILDHNYANQGGALTNGMSIVELNAVVSTQYITNMKIQNYGTFKNGAYTGIYHWNKVKHLTVDPMGYHLDHQSDPIAGGSDNDNLTVANGIIDDCGALGQGIIIDSNYANVHDLVIKGSTTAAGITIGHSGTPNEPGHFAKVHNNTIKDIADSVSGIVIKAGLADNYIVSNNQIIRTLGTTTSGVGISSEGSAVAAGKGGVISGNEISGPWLIGIRIHDFAVVGQTPSVKSISGNHIDVSSKAGSYGIINKGSEDVVISGNYIKSALEGITNSVAGTVIVGNYVDSATPIDLLTGSARAMVVANRLGGSTSAPIIMAAADAGRLIAFNMLPSGATIDFGAADVNQSLTDLTIFNPRSASQIQTNNAVIGSTPAGITNGTTAGKAKTTATVKYRISGSVASKAATDDLWDLTGVTTGAAEYKKVLLTLNASGTAKIIVGTAATSQATAELPRTTLTYAAIGFVELPINYAGGSLSGYVFVDFLGVY